MRVEQYTMSHDTVRLGRNVVFMCRMLRAKALIAGPHTYTFILLRNLVVDRPTEYSVLFAYGIGVVIMYIIHMWLIHYRSTSGGNLNGGNNKIIHEYAADFTNSVYLAITTVQLMHVTAVRETFLVSFIIVTLRVQQTLSGGKRSALFSGPLSLLVVTVLCIAALLSREHEFSLPTARSPFANTDNGLNASAVVALCVLVGASAQAHLQWVVFHEHNDTLYWWNTSAMAFMTFASHIILACVSGFIAAYHPIMIDVDMVVHNSHVGLLIPRLTMTILLLLLCTAPINDSSVMKSILGDGSVVVATVLLVQAHPVMGSVLVITIAVCVSILTFVFVYIRPDMWFQNATNSYDVKKRSQL
jgi:hypothetical protein